MVLRPQDMEPPPLFLACRVKGSPPPPAVPSPRYWDIFARRWLLTG